MHRAGGFVFAALLALVALPATAHDAAMSKEGGAPLGASAAFDPQGHLWMVDAKDGHVWLRRSDDLGRHFAEPIAVNADAEPIYAEGENRPKLAFGPDGEVYVSWSQPRAQPYTGFVRFARSLDGGAHFSAPLTVHHDAAEITHRFDALAVDGHGRVVVAWIDKRDLNAAKDAGQPYLGAAVYYSWSDDRGAHFAPERKLADQSCECCRIALAQTPDGNIAAFFRAIYDDNVRDHAYAVLGLGANPSSAERATFSNWQIAGCPHHGPGLAISHDGVRHAVWYEASQGPALWYGQLDPGHPAKRTLQFASAGASHADVAAQDRHVWLVWNQMDAKGYTLMLRESLDGGANFQPPRALAESVAAVGSPQLLMRQGKTYVAWNTTTGFRLLPTNEEAP
ncbi:exo-alpha-sialidase [Dyella solisilvae]|uniref:Exo-alpha-sialidase n=1 Tax=Dyella solisilvae TaxID=1920168 RepID=A0A370KAW1_9GAMM|nr:sialidase family protein [Dyella solisilvae]RDI99160.1 exo-alpha-sialidase [Dyella solisilvae]